MARQVNAVNNVGILEYVVNASGANGAFTTVQSAIDAAHSAGGGVVTVMPGTYVENITLYGGIDLNGSAVGYALCRINGNITLTNWTGKVVISNMYLYAASGVTLTANSNTSASGTIYFGNCYLISVGGLAFSSTATGSASYGVTAGLALFEGNPGCISISGPGVWAFETCLIEADTGNAFATANGVTAYIISSEIISTAGQGVVVGGATDVITVNGCFGTIFNESVNFTAAGTVVFSSNNIVSSAVSGNWAIGTGVLDYAGVFIIGTAIGIAGTITKTTFPLIGPLSIAGSLTTIPTTSSAATTSFGTSLTAGTAKQNVSGYNILVNVSVNVTSATTATIIMGVGPTSTPTTNTVVASFTVAAATVYSFSAIVPYGYYLLVNKTGTAVIGSITTQACPM